MAYHPERGALPHRTVAPRPGELFEDARTQHNEPPLTPLLYGDAKTNLPDHVTLVCPSCGIGAVHLVGVGVVRREDYEVVARTAVAEWRENRSTRWEHVPLNENVRSDSLLLEFECEAGHASVMELGSHKMLLSARVSRLDATSIAST